MERSGVRSPLQSSLWVSVSLIVEKEAIVDFEHVPTGGMRSRRVLDGS